MVAADVPAAAAASVVEWLAIPNPFIVINHTVTVHKIHCVYETI